MNDYDLEWYIKQCNEESYPVYGWLLEFSDDTEYRNKVLSLAKACLEMPCGDRYSNGLRYGLVYESK